jgi:hypothetical protein
MNRGAFHGAGSFSRRQIRATHFCKIDMCIVGRACAERRFGLPIRHTRMLGPTKIYFIIFGVLTIAGGKAMPAGLMSILAAVGIVMAVLAWMRK